MSSTSIIYHSNCVLLGNKCHLFRSQPNDENLLKYCRGQSPLHIMTSDENKISETNAFLVPRWGGVAIQNINEVNDSSFH